MLFGILKGEIINKTKCGRQVSSSTDSAVGSSEIFIIQTEIEQIPLEVRKAFSILFLSDILHSPPPRLERFWAENYPLLRSDKHRGKTCVSLILESISNAKLDAFHGFYNTPYMLRCYAPHPLHSECCSILNSCSYQSIKLSKSMQREQFT